ncbi:MAG: PAS domain S-box protein [Abitibacteriaceae bacterium]|nr:PAS domain S-box protein [Abditibacteriaceae bacterium]
MTNENSVQRMYIIFGAMLAVLIGMTGISYRTLSSLGSANQWNIHTYQVLTELQGVSNGLDNMQAGAQAFIATGDNDLYNIYLKGKDDLSRHYKTTLSLTTDNPRQQQRLKDFKSEVKNLFKFYVPVISKRRSPQTAAQAVALAAQQASDRESALAQLRSTLNDLRGEEQTLLTQRTQSEGSLERWAHITLIADSLLAIGLASVLSIFLVRSNTLLLETNEGLSKEISDRKKAEREIRDLHEYNEQILSSTAEGIIGVNPRGRITFANPAAAKMVGWDAQQVIGKPVDSILERDMPNATLSVTRDTPLSASMRDGRVHSMADGNFTRRDGGQFSVEYTITPLREESIENNEEVSTITGAVITFRDITVRKRTDMSLLRLASIVESSKDAILSHTLEGRIVSWNAAATKLYGYSPREVEGCSMSILFPQDRTEEVAYLLDKIKNGERIEPYQTMIQTRDGEPIEVALTLYPVRDDKGQVMGASSNARRIIRRRADEQLPVYLNELRLVKDSEQPGGNGQHTTEAPTGGAVVGS